MDFQLKYKLLGLCVVLALSGCNPYLYNPTPTNIPLPYSQNEIKATAGLGSTGLYIEGSYALTNHVVLMGTFVGIGAGSPGDSTGNTGSVKFGQIGGGYYNTWKGFRFEALGSYGMGQSWANCDVKPLDDRGDRTGYAINDNFNSGAVQVDGGLFAKNGEIGISLKLNYINLYNESYNIYLVSNEGKIVDNKPVKPLPSNAFFFEPSCFFSIGIKHIKFISSLGLSEVLGPQKAYWDTNSLNLGLFINEGIMIDLFHERKP